jgi:hypothetical protein
VRVASILRVLTIGAIIPFSSSAFGQGTPTWSAQSLAQLDQNQLLGLYARSPAGPLPAGRVRGTALVRPGTPGAGVFSRSARLVWQGKQFDQRTQTATNQFFGLPIISGQTGVGPSWLDGQPSLILDYQATSRLYRPYRDEIRQVSPNVYLGLMFDRRVSPPKLVQTFVLEPPR